MFKLHSFVVKKWLRNSWNVHTQNQIYNQRYHLFTIRNGNTRSNTIIMRAYIYIYMNEFHLQFTNRYFFSFQYHIFFHNSFIWLVLFLISRKRKPMPNDKIFRIIIKNATSTISRSEWNYKYTNSVFRSELIGCQNALIRNYSSSLW